MCVECDNPKPHQPHMVEPNQRFGYLFRDVRVEWQGHSYSASRLTEDGIVLLARPTARGGAVAYVGINRLAIDEQNAIYAAPKG